MYILNNEVLGIRSGHEKSHYPTWFIIGLDSMIIFRVRYESVKNRRWSLNPIESLRLIKRIVWPFNDRPVFGCLKVVVFYTAGVY